MSVATLEMAADFESIRVLGEWLRTSMRQLGLDATDESYVGPIELAVHELATNSIDHAQADKIVVDAAVSTDALTIKVVDDGSLQFDSVKLESSGAPTDMAEPRVRGYGLIIVEKVAQSIIYDRTDDVNTWKLEFSLQT